MMSFKNSQAWRVEISSEERGGSIRYLEGEHSISGWWEFGGGNTIAIISVDKASTWNKRYPWASERVNEILERIAQEAIRQKAPSCHADIDEENGFIYIR
jgi:hypothetical protein